MAPHLRRDRLARVDGMMTLMSVLTAVVVVAIVKAARNGGRDAAVRVLDERYARGELDGDEFAERRRRLLDR